MTETKRISYLDFARGLAILFMFLQHAMLVHEVSAGEGDGILGNILLLLGTAPAAPVFMIIMGIFSMKSRGGTLESMWRGVKLLFLGYLLNVMRLNLPIFLGGLGNSLLLHTTDHVALFLSVDILQLAGLSLIVTAPLKKLAKVKFFFPLLVGAVLLASPYLWGKYDDLFLFQPLWGGGKNVYFPFFPWVVYPLLGMYLSDFFLYLGEGKNLAMAFLGSVSLLIAALLLYDFFPEGDYQRSGAAVHLAIMAFLFFWLPLCFLIARSLGGENVLIRFFTGWSENITTIYVIQWVLFGWSMLIFGANHYSDYGAALIGVGVILITHFLIRFEKVRKLFAWV